MPTELRITAVADDGVIPASNHPDGQGWHHASQLSEEQRNLPGADEFDLSKYPYVLLELVETGETVNGRPVEQAEQEAANPVGHSAATFTGQLDEGVDTQPSQPEVVTPADTAVRTDETPEATGTDETPGGGDPGEGEGKHASPGA